MTALTARLPPLALWALSALTMWLLAGRPSLLVPSALPTVVLAVLLAFAGLALTVAGVAAFRRAGTTVDPRVPGKASGLVRDGIYRYSRNPMYVGFVALLGAWGAWLGALGALPVLLVYFLWLDRVQIPAEEAAIARLFGADYEAYCAKVRRWL